MDSSVFVFAVDLMDVGVDCVVGDIADQGISGVALACAYHDARDLLPHNPVRKLFFHDGDTVFFQPVADRYGSIRPLASASMNGRDLLGELCDAAGARGMPVTAWTVYLHNARIATEHPVRAPRNAFGDRMLTNLCPADPEVRNYAEALTADICRYPVSSIMAEALHFSPIHHGYHHERYFLDLGPTAHFLLGLCFCGSCMAAADDLGVDGETVRRYVVDVLSEVFDRGGGCHDPLDRELLCAAVGGELGGYLEARAMSVSTTVRAVAGAARDAGVPLTVSVHGGSAKAGPVRPDDPEETWMLGVDLPATAEAADAFEVLAYVDDTAALEPMVDSYLGFLGSTPLAVALRPMFPDIASGRDLLERVAILRRLGAARLDFYHYGLMPRRSLEWVRRALSA